MKIVLSLLFILIYGGCVPGTQIPSTPSLIADQLPPKKTLNSNDYRELAEADNHLIQQQANFELLHAAQNASLITKTGNTLNSPLGVKLNHRVSRSLDNIMDGPGDDYCVDCESKEKLAVKCTPDKDSVLFEGHSVIDVDGVLYYIPDETSTEDFFKYCMNDHVVPTKVEVSSKKKESVAKKRTHTKNWDSTLIDKYSRSPKIDKMIAKMRSNAKKCLTPKNRKVCRAKPPKDRKATRKSTGYCYKYVKLGLLSAGLSSEYLSGGAAKSSGTHLESAGFINLKKSSKYRGMTSRSAPKGAILVYSGGKYGHIEIKAGEREYISDYNAKTPIDQRSSSRKLIGVYVKNI